MKYSGRLFYENTTWFNQCHLAVCCLMSCDWQKSLEKEVCVWGGVSSHLCEFQEAMVLIWCEWVWFVWGHKVLWSNLSTMTVSCCPFWFSCSCSFFLVSSSLQAIRCKWLGGCLMRVDQLFFLLFFCLSLFEPATSDIQHEFVIADIDLFHFIYFLFYALAAPASLILSCSLPSSLYKKVLSFKQFSYFFQEIPQK